jgi:alpha-1,2-mannosyltransferase
MRQVRRFLHAAGIPDAWLPSEVLYPGLITVILGLIVPVLALILWLVGLHGTGWIIKLWVHGGSVGEDSWRPIKEALHDGWRIIPLVRHVSLDSADSWRPINDALHFVRSGHADGLYQETYFKSAFQFIYTPQSLALFDILDRIGWVDWSSWPTLNAISWRVIMTLALLTGWVYRETRRAIFPVPTERANSRDLPSYLLLGAITTFLSFPILKGYGLGQIQTWLTLLLVMSFWAYLTGRAALSGVLLGLVTVVKPHFGLVLIWAVVRREYRLAAGIILTIAALSATSLALYGWPVHREYLDLMSFLSKRGESYFANHAFNGLLNRMFFLGNNLEWDGTHTELRYNPWVHAASVAWSIALILPCLLLRGEGGTQRLLDFSIVLVTAVLASPVAYEHHYGFMLPIFWLVFTTIQAHERPGWVPMVALVFAYALCTKFIPFTELLASTRLNFLQSYMLFGGIVLLFLLYRSALQSRGYFFSLHRHVAQY